jgi:hypothetical protein
VAGVGRRPVAAGHPRVRHLERGVEPDDEVEAARQLGPLQEDPVDDEDGVRRRDPRRLVDRLATVRLPRIP